MGGSHRQHKEASNFLGFSSVVQRGEVWVGGDIQLGDGMSMAWDGLGAKRIMRKMEWASFV